MSFFENTRKPVGLGGKIMVAMMNLGHSPVARWGLRFLELTLDARVLDCGCGGGANIKRLLKKYPQGIVKGIDYSPVSVEKSKKVNEAAIAEGRCAVLQGSVADMVFADDWFDTITAFETVYFWPDHAGRGAHCADCSSVRVVIRIAGMQFSRNSEGRFGAPHCPPENCVR